MYPYWRNIFPFKIVDWVFLLFINLYTQTTTVYLLLAQTCQIKQINYIKNLSISWFLKKTLFLSSVKPPFLDFFPQYIHSYYTYKAYTSACNYCSEITYVSILTFVINYSRLFYLIGLRISNLKFMSLQLNN